MSNISIIIPCYNESKNLNELFEQIISLNSNIEFIIIENGSLDDSKDILNNLTIPQNIKLIFKKKNQGYGAGIKYGFKFINKSNYIGWMHGDLQQPINVLDKLFPIINSNKYNAIKGIRKNRGFVSMFFTIGMSFVMTLLFLKLHKDVAGQPNIISKKYFHLIDSAPNDFAFDFYIYNKILMKNESFYRFKTIFLPRKFGESSWDRGIYSKIKHSIRTLKYLLTLRFF